MRVLAVFLALVAVASALECYVGRLPDAKLTQCAKTDKCCFAGGHFLRGKYFKCEAQCPDFKGRSSVSTSNSEGFQKWCVSAGGECMYNH